MLIKFNPPATARKAFQGINGDLEILPWNGQALKDYECYYWPCFHHLACNEAQDLDHFLHSECFPTGKKKKNSK